MNFYLRKPISKLSQQANRDISNTLLPMRHTSYEEAGMDRKCRDSNLTNISCLGYPILLQPVKRISTFCINFYKTSTYKHSKCAKEISIQQLYYLLTKNVFLSFIMTSIAFLSCQLALLTQRGQITPIEISSWASFRPSDAVGQKGSRIFSDSLILVYHVN